MFSSSIMDPTKKRKADENGAAITTVHYGDDIAFAPQAQQVSQTLSSEDGRNLIETLSLDQRLSILQEAVLRHPDVLADVRTIADRDPIHRKLFVRGLGWKTTTDSLRALFSGYGELDEAVVITEKNTGKSKGYGFVTFKHVDGALMALKQPSKQIDGRMTVTQLAAAGLCGGPNGEDIAPRKIYVGNVPFEVSAERLLSFFEAYGEIEEGPLGFDRQGGKMKGFAFFVYKTEEGAKAALAEPMKTVDGHPVICKLAADGKRGKGNNPGSGTGSEFPGDRMGGVIPSSATGQINPPLGGRTGMGSYPGYGGGNYQPPPSGLGHQAPMNSSMGGPSLGSLGSQGHAGGPGGYGSGSGGGSYYGSQYGGQSGSQSQYGGLPTAEYGSYRVPPSSMGAPPGGCYPDGGPYGMATSGYPTQSQPPSQPPQGPPGGMYQRIPPYY